MVIAQREDGSFSPSKLYDEREHAVKKRDEMMGRWDQMMARFMGPAFDGLSDEVVDYSPHSSEYNFASFAIPRLVASNPLFTTTSMVPGPWEEQMKAHGPALTAWGRRNKLAVYLQDGPATDMCFGPTCTLVTLEDDPTPLEFDLEDEEDPLPGERKRVEIERIDPRHSYFEDPRAKSPERVKFKGHDWTEEVSTLLARAKAHPEEKWNEKLLAELGKMGTQRNTQVLARDPEGPDRNEVNLVTIWVRDAKIDEKNTAKDGYHGAIFTLIADGPSSEIIGAERSVDDEVQWARKPYDFWGHPNGPYCSASVVSIPNKAQGSGPLAMAVGQVEHLYKVAQSNEDAALDWKRVYVGAASLGDVAQKIMDAGHHTVVMSDNSPEDIRKLLAPIELGGLTDQGLAQEDRARSNLEDTLGQDSAGLGNATGEATATENSIADVAREARFSRMELKFREHVLDIAEHVAWYHHHSGEVALVVRSQDSRDTLTTEDGQKAKAVIFRGGAPPEGEMVPFGALEMSIEEHSMNLTTAQQSARRAAEIDNTMLSYMPAMIQNPHGRWADALELRGNLVNVPKLGRLADYDLLKQLQALMLGIEVETLLQPGRQPATSEVRPSGVSRAQGSSASTGSGGQSTGSPLSTAKPSGFSSGRESALTTTGR